MWPWKAPSSPEGRRNNIDDSEWEKTDREADIASGHEYEKRYYDLILASVDRSRTGATTVQAASAAVAALYSGALGLVFSVTASPFPLRGLVTPFFLGLAVVLSTYYLGFIGAAPKRTGPVPGGGSYADNAKERLWAVSRAAESVVVRRSRSLRASVLALAVGLVSMPLPFVTPASVDPVFAAQSVHGSWTAPSLDWPTPRPVSSTAPVELEAIRYQAEVDRYVASLGTEQSTPGGRVAISIFSGAWVLAGLAAVLFGSRAPRRRDAERAENDADRS